jgi:hypothetical protein
LTSVILLEVGAVRRLAILLVLLGAGGGCNYGFQAGSALGDIRTLAVLPFENDTDRLELTQEIYTVLQRELPSALGVRAASEDRADAVVQGTITSYNVTAPNYRPDPTGGRPSVLQREVAISVSVRIVDLRENLVIWESTSVRSSGQYLEQSETEDLGRQEAIDLLVQGIVDGAQSTW